MKSYRSQNRKLFFNAVLRGMAAPVELFTSTPQYHIDAKKILEAPALYKPKKSDLDALRSDWEAVGNDMRSVMRKYVETA